MHAVTCDVCGAKKGEANKWWVLFEADSNKSALIGPIEEAETLQQWKQGTLQFHLCGEGCLYRKLSRVLMPMFNGQIEGTKLAQTSSHHGATGTRGLRANPRVSKESGREDSSFLRSATSAFLRQILRLGKVVEQTAHDSGSCSSNTTTGTIEKLPSASLRETASIGEAMKIIGQIASGGPLYVDGEITGTLALPGHRLTVGPKGTIRAAVCAKEVEIFGVIEGEVRADRVVIRKNATLLGDVRTLSLVIEGGAWFDGKSSMGLGEQEGNGRGFGPTALAIGKKQELGSACLIPHKHSPRPS
jgi:cytoskeletal protein CcmA (bactofilin family)